MNILVINGSPKGQYSITLQTVRYLEALHPEHSFRTLHVGKRIRAFERDMAPAIEALERAELVLFSYPVYTFIAPCQLHRFIELVKESGIVLSGKFATQITTSKHFYDITAHRYIEENCQDMGMKVIRGLSADMEDLLTEKGRSQAEGFFSYVCRCIERDAYEPFPEALPPVTSRQVTVPPPGDGGSKPGDVVIVADIGPEDAQLRSMVDRFRAVFPRVTRVVNIREYPFGGGCLGCFGCAISGKCVYKDGFDDFLRSTVQTAEATVYAFTVRDHSMGSVFKTFDDRQFCNGHRTVTMGSPVGYIISGAYSREHNLRTILEGRAQVGGNFLAGIAADERCPDRDIDAMADALNYAIESGYAPPQNFLGVGGMKIFRDLIWQMRGMMRADHKFFKAHGQYDFPQKKKGAALKMYMVGAMLSNPKIKAKMGNAMNEGMIAPYQKVLEQAGAAAGLTEDEE